MFLKINNKAIIFLIAVVSLLQFSACKLREKVSLVVHHARIYTVNDSFDIKEAMAIQDGKIVALGTNDEILKKCALSFHRLCYGWLEVRCSRYRILE